MSTVDTCCDDPVHAGVVTLVDAKHVGRHLDEEKPGDAVNEALQQIAYADRIVLNKTDLVRPGYSCTF